MHVGWLRDINRDVMSDYLAKWKAPRVEGGFTKMIGLRPTGQSRTLALLFSRRG